jgi:protocatechuate 3,4-dioxygenase beta subunit
MYCTDERDEAPLRTHVSDVSKPRASSTLCITAELAATAIGAIPLSNGRMTSLARITLSAAAAIAVCVGMPPTALACTCMTSGPPCQAYFQSDAVFIGTVDAIEIREMPLDAMPERLYDRKLVRMTVDRASRGVQGARVDVWTGMSDADCGFDFKVGQRYVVYAYRRPDGALGTGICSRTRLASNAAEDLAYLSAPPASSPGARVSGTVNHWERDEAARRPLEYGGVPNVQVLVRGRAGVFSAMTDAEGRYAIERVPPGEYEVELLPPPAFSTRYVKSKFEIRDARACQVTNFSLHYAGRVAGTILDAAGRPAARVRVQIAPAGRPDEPLLVESSLSKADGNGQFELADVAPGEYVAGVGLVPELNPDTVYPRTLFPGTITVGQGNRVDIGTQRLPPAARRYELKGTAVDANGAPVTGANVYLQGARFRQVTYPVVTDADGRFTLPVFEGQSYQIRAHLNLSTNPVRQAQAVQPVTIQGDPPPIRLVLVVR